MTRTSEECDEVKRVNLLALLVGYGVIKHYRNSEGEIVTQVADPTQIRKVEDSDDN